MSLKRSACKSCQKHFTIDTSFYHEQVCGRHSSETWMTIFKTDEDFKVDVTVEDVLAFQPRRHITNNIIDVLMKKFCIESLVTEGMERAMTFQINQMATIFTTINKRDAPANMLSAVRNTSCDLVIGPMCMVVNNHYTVAFADKRTRTIKYYDPFQPEGLIREFLDPIPKWNSKNFSRKKRRKLTVEDRKQINLEITDNLMSFCEFMEAALDEDNLWCSPASFKPFSSENEDCWPYNARFHKDEYVPQQYDKISCGLYVLMFLESLLQRPEFETEENQEDIQLENNGLRNRYLTEISDLLSVSQIDKGFFGVLQNVPPKVSGLIITCDDSKEKFAQKPLLVSLERLTDSELAKNMTSKSKEKRGRKRSLSSLFEKPHVYLPSVILLDCRSRIN